MNQSILKKMSSCAPPPSLCLPFLPLFHAPNLSSPLPPLSPALSSPYKKEGVVNIPLLQERERGLNYTMFNVLRWYLCGFH